MEAKTFSKTEKYLYIITEFNHFFNATNHALNATCKDVFDIIERRKENTSKLPNDITIEDIQDCLQLFHELRGASKTVLVDEGNGLVKKSEEGTYYRIHRDKT